MNKETYKEVPFACNYLASDMGNVKSKRYDKPLKGSLNSCGYKRVQLGSSKNKQFVHRIVALTFLEIDQNRLFVNHKDGNKANNQLSNLEWVTSSENDLHAYANDLKKSKKGEDCHRAKLNNNQVAEIKKLLANNYTCAHIAGIFSVHRKTINDIKLKRTWK